MIRYEPTPEELAAMDGGEREQPKPSIHVAPGASHEIVEQVLRALSESERRSAVRSLFQRAGHLVRLVEVLPSDATVRAGVTLSPGTLRVVRMRPAPMTALVERCADFVGPAGQGGRGMGAKNVPKVVVQAILDAGGDWPFPELRAIANAPVLRHDGTIADVRGFDASTGTFLDIPPSGWGATIPAEPSRDDALAALERLREPFSEFPFVEPVDESVALAGVLTAVSRPALGNAPLFVITAHTRGSGKGLLIAVITAIATGRDPTLMDIGEKEAETRKRITATLMSGAQVASFDNVSRPIRSDALCQVLTAAEYSDRVLCASEIATMPTTGTTWFASGNNVAVVGDMTRRVILCRLDAGVERPEDRSFGRVLPSWALERREELVAAALTVLRAFHVAGCPGSLPPWGSFERWGHVVRGALVWLGLSDPLETRDAVEVDDTERQERRALHEAWLAAFGDRAVTARDAAKHPKLRDVWRGILDNPEPSSGDVSTKVLRGHKGCVLEGRRLVREDGPRKTSLWRLVEV